MDRDRGIGVKRFPTKNGNFFAEKKNENKSKLKVEKYIYKSSLNKKKSLVQQGTSRSIEK